MMTHEQHRPLVIAGPCAAENFELMDAVGGFMTRLAKELDFRYIFKASFDKANRTSGGSERGPGIQRAGQWFSELKNRYGFEILSDIHETYQVELVAPYCDVLQIPAFLCRQTDLVLAAAKSGRIVNIKKGQFMAPHAMAHIVDKARSALAESSTASSGRAIQRVWLTERGVSFGYGNLVVDMRSFPIMAKTEAPLLLDITHSTQLPAAGGEGGGSSGAQRSMAPTLARAATATGYLSGYFLEVHTNPAVAISDREAQLNLPQAEALLRQLIPLWHQSRNFAQLDALFKS